MKLPWFLRKAVIAHLLWAALTIGALMLGAQLADKDRDEDFRAVRIPTSTEHTKIPDEVEDSEGHVYVPLPGVKHTKSADLVPVVGRAKSMIGLMRSRNRQAAQRLLARDASAAMLSQMISVGSSSTVLASFVDELYVALAIASCCCWPPLRSPPLRVKNSFRTGNSS